MRKPVEIPIPTAEELEALDAVSNDKRGEVAHTSTNDLIGRRATIDRTSHCQNCA